jgi:hypothetical protein
MQSPLKNKQLLSGIILLSSLFSEVQEPPSLGLKLRTLFRSFDPSIFSNWTREISIPSLVQIDLSVLDLEANIHTHTYTERYRMQNSTS